MIAEAITKIEDMARADYLKTMIGEEIYSYKKLVRVKRPDQASPDPVCFSTLSGFCGYVCKNSDELNYEELFVHVASHDKVALMGRLQPANDNDRFGYATAVCGLKGYEFGQWQELEKFIIALQSQFVETPVVNEILSVLGNLAAEHIRENKDTGFSQVVQVKVGIALRREVELKNPVALAPYRTFREVDQPVSNTIMRLRQGREFIECVLFESDGGAWRIDAMRNVAAFVRAQIPAVIPVFY